MYGHKTGDELLKIFSKRISSLIKSTDMASRVGGDEFVLLIKDVDQIQIEVIAKRILDKLAEPVVINGNVCNVGASIGISTYPNDGTSVDELISKSDGAMYNVKQEGKNNYKIASQIRKSSSVNPMFSRKDAFMRCKILSSTDCNLKYIPSFDFRDIAVQQLIIKPKDDTSDTRIFNLNKHKPKILIIEDDPVNQKIVSIFLSKHCYESDIASNGREGLEKFFKNNYDFIFMDCQMPEIDGYDATRTIRLFEEKLNSRTKIIAMTANTLVGEREKCLECGMDEYIAKPIDFKLLTEKCNAMFQQKK